MKGSGEQVNGGIALKASKPKAAGHFNTEKMGRIKVVGKAK